MLGAVTQIPARTDSCDHSLYNLAGVLQQQAGGVEELRLGVGALCVYIQCVQCWLCDAEGSVQWQRMGEMIQHRGAIIVIEYEGRRRKLSVQIAAC